MPRQILWLCVGIVCLTPLVVAQTPGQRQYYSAWQKHTSKNYYYCNFYFKKSASDTTYTYHYAIYFPSRGKRIFMYNPQTRKYWGAWEGDKYSLLPKEKQKASIDEIAAEDFPAFGAAPNIPGIDERIPMIAPKDFPKLDDDRP